MKFRNDLLIFMFLFFFMNSNLYAQEELKVIKVDNSKFPEIELFLNVKSNFNPKEISITENNSTLEISIDTVKQNEIVTGQSIMFIIDVNSSEEIRKALAENIKQLNETYKINIGIILKSDTSKNFIHFLSPEFSKNHFFYINTLEKNLFTKTKYGLKKREIKSAEKFFANIQKRKDVFSGKGVIFINKSLKVKPEPVTNFLTKKTEPVYIILTEKIEKEAKNKLIDICTKTGGIFTEINKRDLYKTISRYIEDISLQANTAEAEVIRIVFTTEQNKPQNRIIINYRENSIEKEITKPKKIFNKRENILLILSGLLATFLILSLFYKKKKITIPVIEKSLTNQKTIKPIEINVKTKGFNKTYFFEKHIISIGRSSSNDIIIPDRTVSGSHAVINKEGEFFKIQDLGSTNGVVVNQKKIKTQKLVSKDKIKLGGAILVVRI
ncbi:MAG: FHA domain-containing protein [Bacteroidales bacterium]|nr:FHA domain-containing protein [Bacteroidales bacterium]